MKDGLSVGRTSCFFFFTFSPCRLFSIAGSQIGHSDATWGLTPPPLSQLPFPSYKFPFAIVFQA